MVPNRRAFDFGLNQVHEVVVALEFELEQELERVLVWGWAMMLVLKLILCEGDSMIVGGK